MICDRCAEPASGRAVVLCTACRTEVDTARDRRAAMRAVLDRREAHRRTRYNEWRKALPSYASTRPPRPAAERRAETRRRYRQRRAARQCVVNGCTAPLDGSVFCARHHRAATAVRARMAAEARTEGRCPRCLKEPAAAGRVVCRPCGAQIAEARRARQAARHAAQVCTRCGRASVAGTGRATCAACRARKQTDAPHCGQCGARLRGAEGPGPWRCWPRCPADGEEDTS